MEFREWASLASPIWLIVALVAEHPVVVFLNWNQSHRGMDLRDYFAAKAIARWKCCRMVG